MLVTDNTLSYTIMQTPDSHLKLAQSAVMQPLIPGLPDAVADHCLLRVAYDHLSLLDSVCRGWRDLLRSADFHARRRLAGITRSLLVLHVQEFQKSSYKNYMTLFDPVSGTWSLLNRAHTVLSSMIGSPTIIGTGRSMVAIGWQGSPPVRIYDFHTGHWREGAPIPGQERDFFYVAWNGASRVFVINRGSHTLPIDTVVQSVMSYDKEEDKWEILTGMPASSFSLAVAYQDGAFHRLRDGNNGKLLIDSFDESSREWRLGELERVKFNFIKQSMQYAQPMYAIGEDGNIFCLLRRKIRVKNYCEDDWRELLDLPADVENCVYLTSWKGGVLVAGTVSQGAGRGNYPLNVYTLMLDHENGLTPPTWIAQSVPNAGSEGQHRIKGFWLEI